MRSRFHFSILKVCVLLSLTTSNATAYQELGVIDQSAIAANPSDDPPTTQRLKAILTQLVDNIGERNLSVPDRLDQTADFVERTLHEAQYKPQRQTFEVDGHQCHNIIAEIRGNRQPDQIILIGAHYDSAPNSPGANDNGSGVAGLLAIAESLQMKSFGKTLRFVFFANEEPPYFQRENAMGSWVYARQCRQRGDDLKIVISLETIGYFTDEKNSQHYPPLLASMYPDQGNFIGFVSNMRSRGVLLDVLSEFRKHCKPEVLKAEFATLPTDITGVGWSDHWSFWQEDYTGLMITDTALFRYPHYHRPTDTVDKIEFKRYTALVDALATTIAQLAK